MGRRGRRGGAAFGGGGAAGGGISESTMVKVAKVLEDFLASDKQVHEFESGLSKQERAAIHEMCRKKGMISKSSGKGGNRRLSVYKCQKNGSNKNAEDIVTELAFSEESKSVLRDLFIHYPPEDSELSQDAFRISSETTHKQQRKVDSSFCRPSMRPEDIKKKIEALATKMTDTGHLKKIVEDRARLPIWSFKDAINSALEANKILLISGETGCGKTTQVPQFILDHMWGKGESCKIVCTQPRRISAMSVAERISFERGEAVGDTVGYKIRLESKGGKHSSIIFCTNGVLLRLLIGRGTNYQKSNDTEHSSDDPLSAITHIIVDEIHERDRFSDFMLTILRDLLPLYPHLRMVLMSATIDAERFSLYFGGCPVIQVPGFTFPVKTFYLEDILSILRSLADNHLSDLGTTESKDATALTEECRSALDEAIALALSNDELEPLLEFISSEHKLEVYNYQHSVTGVSPLMVLAAKGRVAEVCMLLSFGVDCSAQDKDGKSSLDWAQQENQEEIYEIMKKHIENGSNKLGDEEELLNRYLASVNPEHIDITLIERLLKKICSDSEEGAILVFLAGWEDISLTRERLLASAFFRDSSKYLILSLHSMVPSSEQKKVFKRPPDGVRKIILSTNIAETAVTIDDVVFVIDTGRMKEKSYDPYNNVSTLHSSWVSKANARQREGRAGRCQPGICYHLYSKFRAASLPEYQVPEIKRMPIEELCLQVKLLDPSCKISNFLQKTLDPPVPETVRNATTILQEIGALTLDEQLTELGETLGSLPTHPSTSKMLIFAILMNCLDPALTLACAADYREPFILPVAPEDRRRADMAKIELASLYGGYSDQLAVVAAFECWKNAKERGLEGQFCSRYFVSSNTMNMLFSMRNQLQSELVKMGLLPADVSSCSLNAKDPGILRAVLMAGAYPLVGRLLRRKVGRGSMIETVSTAKVRLHPHSCNFNLSLSKSSGNPLVVYDEITRGDGGMYIKNSSVVGPYPLLLLATEMVVAPPDNDDESEDEFSSDEDDNEINRTTKPSVEKIMGAPDNTVVVVVDRWLRFESTAFDVAQLYCLRERLSAATLFKVKHPQEVLPPALGASIYAVACILSYDALPALSTADESMEAQTSNADAVGGSKNSFGRREKGYAKPCGFLRSLISNRPRGGSCFQNTTASNNSSGMPVRSQQPKDSTNRVRNRRPPFRSQGQNNCTPRVGSVKRRRGSNGPEIRKRQRHHCG